jgi:tryptophanyl-tRNA synthetase
MNKYVSGIRPSGKLHLGNYLGAIKSWRKLQDAGNRCVFFVANMHGQHSNQEIADTLLALKNCGLSQSSLWLQSQSKAGILSILHELSFYANTSRLDNMTQYKQKGGTLALYAYPVLMAADIFYHKGTHVPIGEDQSQHLELVRELARKTGRKEPVAVTSPVGKRIMSLSNPLKKMSKSDDDENGCVYLNDNKDDISRKIKMAVSSPEGISNLLEISKALGCEYFYNGKNEPLKKHVTDLIINELRSSHV